MFKPDTIAEEELKQVAHNLTPWFDSSLVEKLVTAAADDVPASHQPQSLMAINSNASASGAADRAKGFTLPDEFTLEECFAIYMLGANSITDPASLRKDIKYLARETERWHHQIKAGGKPVAFARSKATAYSKGCEICQLYISDLAKAVDDAIQWLMKFEDDNKEYTQTEPLVRLLAVPAYNVHAFWLLKQKSGQSDLLVIDAPAELGGLKREQLLNSAEFLKAFEGHTPISGLIVDGVIDEEDDEEPESPVSHTRNPSDALIKTGHKRRS